MTIGRPATDVHITKTIVGEAVFRPDPFLELELGPERWAAKEFNHATGIYVRANVAGKWESVDIAVLAPQPLFA